MKEYKSNKIHEVVHENDRKLNLHEIKAKTGAGSGHKHSTPISKENSINDAFVTRHKSHSIYDVVNKIEGRANLHQIKAKTGAGNGYKNHINDDNSFNASTETSKEHAHKSHRIHAIFHEHDRRLNLHEIKAKTGAGSGHKH